MPIDQDRSLNHANLIAQGEIKINPPPFGMATRGKHNMDHRNC